MYDFTSADILNEVISVIQPGNMQFKMVLDHPPRNPTANQTDDVTRTDILNADANAEINWALTRSDPVVTEWIFPTSYHIKVAVRDSKAFMLSSGNYNVSNQPNLAAGDPTRGSLANADRDWHVIVLDPEMALLLKLTLITILRLRKMAKVHWEVQTQHNLIKSAMSNLARWRGKSIRSRLVNTAPASYYY